MLGLSGFPLGTTTWSLSLSLLLLSHGMVITLVVNQGVAQEKTHHTISSQDLYHLTLSDVFLDNELF